MSAVIEFRPGKISQEDAASRCAKCTEEHLQGLEVQMMQFKLQQHQRAMKSKGVRPCLFLAVLLLVATVIAGGAFCLSIRVSGSRKRDIFGILHKNDNSVQPPAVCNICNCPAEVPTFAAGEQHPSRGKPAGLA